MTKVGEIEINYFNFVNTKLHIISVKEFSYRNGTKGYSYDAFLQSGKAITFSSTNGSHKVNPAVEFDPLLTVEVDLKTNVFKGQVNFSEVIQSQVV